MNAQRIIEILVDLAIEDELPMDIGSLDPNLFAEFDSVDKTSWIETHYQVVEAITLLREKGTHPVIQEINDTQGTGGFWELSQSITDEFEKMNEGRDWNDGSFFDELEEFIDSKLKRKNNNDEESN